MSDLELRRKVLLAVNCKPKPCLTEVTKSNGDSWIVDGNGHWGPPEWFPAVEADPGIAITALDEFCKKWNKDHDCDMDTELYAAVSMFSDCVTVHLIVRGTGDLFVNEAQGPNIAIACCRAILASSERTE